MTQRTYSAPRGQEFRAVSAPLVPACGSASLDANGWREERRQ